MHFDLGFEVQDSLDTTKRPKEFSITALFEGITATVIGDDNKDIVCATVTGISSFFSVVIILCYY